MYHILPLTVTSRDKRLPCLLHGKWPREGATVCSCPLLAAVQHGGEKSLRGSAEASEAEGTPWDAQGRTRAWGGKNRQGQALSDPPSLEGKTWTREDIPGHLRQTPATHTGWAASLDVWRESPAGTDQRRGQRAIQERGRYSTAGAAGSSRGQARSVQVTTSLWRARKC